MATPSTSRESSVRPMPTPGSPTRSTFSAHPSLLDPRYSHLRHEAQKGGEWPRESTPTPSAKRKTDMPPPPFIPVKVHQPEPSTSGSQPQSQPSDAPRKPYAIPSATPLRPPSPDRSSSATKKVLGWMGSFLGKGPVQPPKKVPLNPLVYPVLPPVSDADREALKHVSPVPSRAPERIVHPKDQVELQHVPTPEPARPPKKLDLKRKGSVKDLVKSFEGVQEDKRAEEKRKMHLAARGEMAILKRLGSNGSLRSMASNKTFDTSGEMSSRDISGDLSRSFSYEDDSGLNASRSTARSASPAFSDRSMESRNEGSILSNSRPLGGSLRR